MTLRFRLLPAALTALIMAAPLHAQDAPRHGAPDGTSFSAGIGGGWTRVTCGICRNDRNLGPAGYIRVGTSVRPGLIVAAEIDGWTRSQRDVRSNAGAGGIATYIYPDPHRGLFLKGGLAYVRYSEASGSAASNLFGLMLGTGYELPVARNLRVTNYVNLVASSFGSFRTERATVASDISLSIIQFGIGLTRH
jgi:hypothetical protein